MDTARSNSLVKLNLRMFVVLVVVIASQVAMNRVVVACDLDATSDSSGSESAATHPSPEQKRLYAGIRDAIYKNRKQLLEMLGDPRSRSMVCTPAPNDSYEQFQAAIRDDLDVLWDLDLYATKYGLTKKQHHLVKTCATQMETYLDNFKSWEELNKQ